MGEELSEEQKWKWLDVTKIWWGEIE